MASQNSVEQGTAAAQQFTSTDILHGLNQARDVAFNDGSLFPQVVRQVLNFVSHEDIKIKHWCASFLKDTFETDDTLLKYSEKVDLAIDTVESLIFLANVDDIKIFQNVVDTSIVVYKLIFKYVNDNDGCDEIWNNLNQLKISLTSKFNSNFPLPPSDNEEFDKFRNILTKIELVKFIILVIDYQTVSNANVSSFNCRMISSNHSLIKKSAIQAEASGLLNNLLEFFNLDILIPSIINPLLVHLTLLVKRKEQFVPKILSVIEKFDTKDKLQSNYQSLEEFKLSQKYIDRVVRIFIQHLQKFKLIPHDYQSILSAKLSLLIERGDAIRRRHIIAASPDDVNIKKRKFTGFANSSKKLESLEYKNLYSLTDSSNQLNFDLSTLPPQILVTMIMNALKKVDGKRLTKALDIIADRYKYGIENRDKLTINRNKRLKMEHNDGDEDDEDGDDENLEFDNKSVYNLPPPKELSYQDKREQINLIIRNFFKLSETNVKEVEEKTATEDGGINKELTKIAIQSWQKKSWLVILTRLATRGMRTIDTDDNNVDQAKNNELSDLIRNALVDFFLENIHGRIDLIIEWLNEEWYSETVFNELKVKNELKAKYAQQYQDGKISDLDGKVDEEFNLITIDTPIYDKWSSKILTSIIPFLEANDRKIFIRLLSDLPSLTDELVSGIKSLCVDPVRSKLGFLSLQFLLMYRPPVKNACIKVLRELSATEDSQDEANKLLAKYVE